MIQNRFNQSIDNLKSKAAFSKVALSISGGSDSIALLHLFAKWANINQVKFIVLSVNHNLRPESIHEIEFVQTLTKSLGHSFYALNWVHDESKSALQKRARDARYKLMTDKCHKLGIKTLLTAHHQDDMLENYIMRTRKKSGAFGLSYSNTYFNNDIQILRPLLFITKNELVSYLKGNKYRWREDSSNSSDDYERNRVRKEINGFSFDYKSQLFEEMQECNDKANILNKQLLHVIAEYVYINKFGFALINIEKINQQHNDIRIQVLNYILTIISGKDKIPRYRSVGKIISLLDSNYLINHSLHGCILKNYNNKLLVYREKQQINNELIKNKDGYFWDNRFLLKLDKIVPEFKIETLNINEYKLIREEIFMEDLIKIVGNNHKSILFTLPVVKTLEKIIAIPHIYYYNKVNLKDKLQAIFSPRFISRFTHFL